MRKHKLDGPELGSILAALRFYQLALLTPQIIPAEIVDISTDTGEFPALTSEQIDEMAEWLNRATFHKR